MTDRHRTGLIHHPYRAPDGFEAPQAGVFKASTVIFADVAAMRARDWKDRTGYTYGLHGTPTTFLLEERIAHLEGGLQTLLVPSGLAAITLTALALLEQGDEVLVPSNAYGPATHFLCKTLLRFGITHRVYDPLDTAAQGSLIGPQTRLLWLEAPGSVTMEFPDLRALTQLAREAGVVTALDNTWGAGIAFDPFALGVDVSMQALTKFPSGGGDVLMGSVTTRDEKLHLRLTAMRRDLGLGVGANDVETLLRSLPSIALRYHEHDRVARGLAAWLQARPEIKRLLHPAFEGSPGHEFWKRDCSAAAGLFSVQFDARYSPAQVDRFVDALKLFRIGYSWAGPISLVVPYRLASMRNSVGDEGTLVRFSIGLEAEQDLRADLEQALSALS